MVVSDATMILLDSGLRNVACKRALNAIYGYSHRRLMDRAEVSPANSDPGNQNGEHLMLEQDYPQSRALCQIHYNQN